MSKNMRFKITERELYLAVAFAVIGFVFSLREVVIGLSSLSPVEGLVVYYIILYASLYVLSRLGLTIFGLKIERPLQILGLGLVTFAFFILVNWESGYVNLVVYNSETNLSQLYCASEDGALWWVFYDVLGIKDLEIARLLTYVLMPFLLALAGGFLLEQQVTLDEEIHWKFWKKRR